MRFNLRRTLMLGFVIVLIVGGIGTPWSRSNTPAEAGGSWSTWLYNPTTQKLVHVFPGAPAVEMLLPVSAANSPAPPTTVAISPNGDSLAFCIVDANATATVYVYDLVNMTQLLSVPKTNVAYCDVGPKAFRDDGAALAVTFLYNPAQGNNFPSWELSVIGLSDPNATRTLYQSDAPVVAAGANAEGMYPRVTMFTGMGNPFVIFRLASWGPGGSCEMPAFYWNMSTNDIAAYESARHTVSDYLAATGELIWIINSPSLPQNPTVTGGGCMGNMVMYGSKATQPYPIYVDAENLSLLNAAFINGGQQLALWRSVGGALQWEALDRNGNTFPLPASVDAREVRGVVDGYVFVSRSPNGPQLVYHRLGTQLTPEESVLWQGASGELWTIAWVAPLPSVSLPPFPRIPLGD